MYRSVLFPLALLGEQELTERLCVVYSKGLNYLLSIDEVRESSLCFFNAAAKEYFKLIYTVSFTKSKVLLQLNV